MRWWCQSNVWLPPARRRKQPVCTTSRPTMARWCISIRSCTGCEGWKPLAPREGVAAHGERYAPSIGHGAPRAPGEEQPRVVWCVPERVPREPSDVQTPAGARPHRSAAWRTSHAREEDIMDHPDYPVDPATMVSPSLQDLVQHLRGYEGQLPEAVRRPLVAAGAALIPALITLVEDALADDQTAWGWAPLHAIDLLGASGDARAVPVLL